MVALGVQNDAPPIALQPGLVDGVHLLWAFPRTKGFRATAITSFGGRTNSGQRCITENLVRLAADTAHR